MYVKSEQYNHLKQKVETNFSPGMENWYFNAMDMQCASSHSAVQRMPTFNALVVIVVGVCFYPYRKTKNHTSTLTESLRALAIKLWKQVKTICYCPSSIQDFIFPKGAGIITCHSVTMSNTFVNFEPFLTNKEALAIINWAEVCVWNMSTWSLPVLKWILFHSSL